MIELTTSSTGSLPVDVYKRQVVDEAYFTGSRAESGTQGGGNYQNQGFNQGGFNAPQSQPAQGSEPNFGDDFDMGDFSDLDGSEDDLPF